MILRWVLLLACGWLAATVSGVAGFGGALLLLPVLSLTVGVKAAIPILTLAQLFGNFSRAGFGRDDIRWRPALVFTLGAVPASVLGSRFFVELPPPWIFRIIGFFLIVVVALRHTALGKQAVSEVWLAPAGSVVGFVSAIAGSAGPLGAAVFLSLNLPPKAYVATEAVTAVFIHLTKTLIYGRYSVMSPNDFLRGFALGAAMVIGSWTGRKLNDRLPEVAFVFLVETLLVISALSLIVDS